MLCRPPLSYVMTAFGVVVVALFAAGLLHADHTIAGMVVVVGGVVIGSVGVATLRDIGGTARAFVAYGRAIPQIRLPARWDAVFWRVFPRVWGALAVLIGTVWTAGGIWVIARH